MTHLLNVVAQSRLVLIPAALGACLMGCNSSNAPSPLSPMTTMTAELQNRAGCLDYGLLNQRISKAKKFQNTLVDVKYDRSPSESMLYNSRNAFSDSTENDFGNVTQDDCKTLTYLSSSGEQLEGRIIEHSRTRLRFQVDMPVPADNGKIEETSISKDITVQLIAENRISVRQVVPSIQAHVCNGKPEEERIQATSINEIDFGDTLPHASQPSAELTTIRNRVNQAIKDETPTPSPSASPSASASEENGNGDEANSAPKGKDLEEQYCKTGQ